MDLDRRVSSRWRVHASLAAGGAALRFTTGASAQDDDTRHDSTASPVAVGGSDHLSSLLSLIPVSVVADSQSTLSITFGDMAAQLAAGGLTPPDSIEDDEAMGLWINASYPIVLAEPLRSRALQLDRSLLGFDITDIDQTMEAGLPPGIRSLFRGRFDQPAIVAAWERNGYKMLNVDGFNVASLFEDAEIDLNNDISRLALTRMNNATFLPDGTLAYAPTLSLLTEMISVANGATESAASHPEIATLLSSLDESLASAIFFAGADVSTAAQLPPELVADAAILAEIEDQLSTPESMPPIALGLIGITAGGPTVLPPDDEEPLVAFPAAKIIFRLLMGVSGTAESAATVASARLGSMQSSVSSQSYSELYQSWEASSLIGGDVLGLDMFPGEGYPVSIWTRGLFSRDLLFLAW